MKRLLLVEILCNGLELRVKRHYFNLNIRPGLTNSSVTINNNLPSYQNITLPFNSQLGFRIGAEAEFILPFNKNKWAIILEPTYKYYKASLSELPTGGSYDTIHHSVNYKTIDLPFGLRYSFFINNNSKVFVNGSFVTNIDLGSKILQDNQPFLDVKTSNSFQFGVGYCYKKKFSIEVRFDQNKDIASDYSLEEAKYSSMAFILGYNIF